MLEQNYVLHNYENEIKFIIQYLFTHIFQSKYLNLEIIKQVKGQDKIYKINEKNKHPTNWKTLQLH